MAQVTVAEAFELALQQHRAGNLQEAAGLYREILAVHPEQASSAQVHNNLAVVLNLQGHTDEAVAQLRRALELKPELLEALANLAAILRKNGELEEAGRLLGRALSYREDWAGGHSDLGAVLQAQGRHAEAEAEYRRAIALEPGLAAAHSNLSHLLQIQGRLDPAIAAARQAVALQADDADAHNNLGVALKDAGYWDEAIKSYRRAIALRPDWANAHNNLGNALQDSGRVDEALAEFRVAMKLKPAWAGGHSNLLFALHYQADDAGALAAEHRRWDERFAQPLRSEMCAHTNVRVTERRLRVGYVSGDFRNHVAGWTIEPVLARHGRTAFDVYCYYNHATEDEDTRRMRASVDQWRSIHTLDDARTAELIRADGIDILVDLSLHTSENRLLVFARKPAPVQVVHVGYPSTTGLTAIDYRLTDAYLEPPGTGDAHSSEKLVRLPHCWYLYVRPHHPTQAVGVLPALKHGGITFGSLNSLAKIPPPVVEVWSRILRALPTARLIAGPARQMPSGDGGEWRAQWARHGVADRVRLAGRIDSVGYMQLYDDIDIALDPFPYNGGNVTCDALWMGVPVVTLRGHTGMGRAGVSILSTVGLAELIAEGPEEYVRLAVELARDLPRLRELRAGLRARVQGSALTDAAGYTRDLEAAYRQMWRTWCATGS